MNGIIDGVHAACSHCVWLQGLSKIITILSSIMCRADRALLECIENKRMNGARQLFSVTFSFAQFFIHKIMKLSFFPTPKNNVPDPLNFPLTDQ